MATQAMTTREEHPIAQFQSMLETRAREIQSALPAHISPEKFQRTVMTAVAQNPDLLKADRQSLILACYKAAQDALLPDGREAALVTFNTRQKIDGEWCSVKLVQYMPMVYGLRKKVLQSAEVVSLEVNVVYRAEVEKGTFLYEVGIEPPLRHRPSLDLTEEETSDDQIVAAYSIATMKDGSKSYELMRRFEINKVRQVSQTGALGKTTRSGEATPPKGPWVDWFAEMAKKTVMRRHAKTLPMTGDILIDVEGRELEVGTSTARALGGTAPDAPTAIEDRSDETPAHDAETGELIDDGAGDALGAPEAATEAEPAKKTPAKPAKAEEPTPASNGIASEGGPTGASGGEQAKTAAVESEDDGQIADDDGGPKPEEEAAGAIINEMFSANSIVDVNSIYARHKADIDAMPPEIGAKIDIFADQHKATLKARNATEKAKESEPAK